MNFTNIKHYVPWVLFGAYSVKCLIFPCNSIDLGITAIIGAVLCALEYKIKLNYIQELEQVKFDYNKIIEDLYKEVQRNREEVQGFKMANQYKTLTSSFTSMNK